MRINSVNYVTFPRTNVIIKCSHSGEACHNPSKDIDPSTSGDQKTTSKALYQKQAIGVQCPVPPSLLSKADTCHDRSERQGWESKEIAWEISKLSSGNSQSHGADQEAFEPVLPPLWQLPDFTGPSSPPSNARNSCEFSQLWRKGFVLWKIKDLFALWCLVLNYMNLNKGFPPPKKKLRKKRDYACTECKEQWICMNHILSILFIIAYNCILRRNQLNEELIRTY